MFIDRQDAGEQLAKALMGYKNDDPIILALPRGGVPIGKVVADALAAPLDVLLVRKIGAPGQSELAIGAVADGAEPVLFIDKQNANLVGASDSYIQGEMAHKLEEIATRRQMYSATRRVLPVKGRTIILVDDGIATGATVKVALKSLRAAGAKFLVLAVPLAPKETLADLEEDVDEIVCLIMPEPFYAISPHYQNFNQVPDSEVVEILANSK